MKKLISLSYALLMIVSLGVMFQSCKSSKNSASTATTDLNGTWVLASFNGDKPEVSFKGKIPTMNVNLSTKLLNGNAGCNTYTGSFTYSNGIFSAPKLATTMMACLDANQESQFLAMLAGNNTVSIDKGVLSFKNGTKTVATFIKGIDTSLLFGEWILETISGGDLKTLYPTGNVPTLTFDTPSGKVVGNAGCNRYNATYKIEGTSVIVGPSMTTRMTCPNIGGETKFTQTLAGTSQLSVDGKTLTFIKDGVVTLKFVRK